MRDSLRALLDLVLPVGCGGCGAPGAAWCTCCQGLLGAPVRVHPPGCPGTVTVYALGAYRGRLRAALLAYKERGRRDLADPLAAGLAAALLRLPLAGPGRPLPGAVASCPPRLSGVYLVPVPSRWSAAARRGGQHVARVADRAAAALAGAGVTAAVAPALRMSCGVRDSVGLNPAARQANLAGRVLLRPAGLPPAGTPAVLVDDVVTTGATIAACTKALLQGGVVVPTIVVIAASDRHFK